MDIGKIKPHLKKNFDVVNLGENGILFKSEHAELKFEGRDIQDFVKILIPLLDGNKTVAEICQSLHDYKNEDIERCVILLAENGLLEDWSKRISEKDSVVQEQFELGRISPQLELFQDFGIPKDEALKKLRTSKIAVFGLGAHGAELVLALAREGIGNIRCIDPSKVRNEDLYLSAIYTEQDIGRKREDVLKERISAYPSTIVETSNVDSNASIVEEDIRKGIEGCNFAVSCVDKGFSSINYWLNKAAFEIGLSWCMTSLQGMEGVIGPIIIPSETACHMCYTMRLLANEKSYDIAMAYQKYLAENKRDELYRRSNLSTSSGIMGNFLALELIKQITGIMVSKLIGKICVFDFLNLAMDFHTVLRKPDCPLCGLKKKLNVDKKNFASTYDSIQSRNISTKHDILNLESELVSPRVGLINSIHRVLKDGTEPDIPIILGVILSNSNYHEGEDKTLLMCSGKGLSLQEAKRSALGEAIERYCGGYYDESTQVVATYDKVKDKAINPISMVLYSKDQYDSEGFHYSKFSENTPMRWVVGESLITHTSLLVPSIGVYLDYEPFVGEYLFSPTSNGLAAGNSYYGAVLNGLLEVIERDSFLISWLCKLPMPIVDLSTVKSRKIKDLISIFEKRNVKIFVNALLLDTGVPTFLTTAVDSSGNQPAACVGLSAHPDPEIGIFKSILEVGQIRPSLRREMKKLNYDDNLTRLFDFCNVKTIQDHELLYTSPKMLGAFDFLHKNDRFIGINEITSSTEEHDEKKMLEKILVNMKNAGYDVIAVDLTTPDIEQFGLSAVRVIVPEFQPMHFGQNEIRLGGKRLYSLPCKLGFSDKDLEIKDLNPFPHPLG